MGLLNNKGVVGLEFDSGELRGVELRGNTHSARLVSWGRVSLPLSALEKGNIVQPQVVAQALQQLWEAGRFKSRQVVCGVFNQNVLVRFASFEPLSWQELEQNVLQQASNYLPVSLESVVLDYALIGETEEEMEVLMVAAQREMIDSFLSVLQQAKLKPRDIYPSPLVLRYLLFPGAVEDAVALLNLENGASTLLLTVNGVPRLARQLTVGLLDAAHQLDCPLEEVVERAGASPGEPFEEAFIDWGETLVGEVQASISYYLGQPDASPVRQMILSGPGARISGFAEQLQEIFAIPVLAADPLQLISKRSKETEKIHGLEVDFALGFALAREGLEGKA